MKDQHELDEEQCKCKTHENFFSVKLKGLKVDNNKTFEERFLCDDACLVLVEGECWKNTCESCEDGHLVESMTGIGESETVVWKKWCKCESDGRVLIEFVDEV